MNDPVTLFGFEIVRFYPALALLFLLVLGTVGKNMQRGAVMKGWSGEQESHLASRFRSLVPRLLLFLGTVCIIFAIADVTRAYIVEKKQYATNRFYLMLDNSSSMYKNYMSWNEPIHCTDKNLKKEYPRIFGACRATMRIINAVEAYGVKKTDEAPDQIGILRFGQYSFVEMYGTTDYDHARMRLEHVNWRDSRVGGMTEVHYALWDAFQVALQRNLRHAEHRVPLDERDMAVLMKSLTPEKEGTRYHVPKELRVTLEALRADLKDTVFVIVSDGEFSMNRSPVSLSKMLQLAEFLEVPVYVINIGDGENREARELVEKTGSGPLGGPGRGAHYLLRAEQDFRSLDAVVDNILKTRLHTVESKPDWRRKTYTPLFGLLGAVLLFAGVAGGLTIERKIGRGGLA